jgi:transposase-like protein
MTAEREGAGSRRRHFEESYKKHAVELTLRGDRTIRAVAKELGISEWTLNRWRKRYAPGPNGDGDVPRPARTLEQAEGEIRRLREELARMQDREIVLKKSLGILSETPGSGMPKSKR